MHIHILGICGTFMGGIAHLARALGHNVTGSDQNVYPPMSDQLEAAGIELRAGYDPAHLDPSPDLVLIGNALSRGNDAVEYVLNKGIPYSSGPAWLKRSVLNGRQVIAVAGTHGKTTTTSLITWMLAANGIKPGYLIGGRANNFELTAELGEGKPFVIEADEYDTAFFDKRSKFVHYKPDIFIINNIEFDHADIFDSVDRIRRQFHHAVRIIPGNGLIIANGDDEEVNSTLKMGCWSRVHTFGSQGAPDSKLIEQQPESAERFEIASSELGSIKFSPPIPGVHNAFNTLAAIIACKHVGLELAQCLNALDSFKGVKRRLDNYATIDGVALFDDFAHHPTAIRATLRAMRQETAVGRLICVLEPRSNTMQDGTHSEALKFAFEDADLVFLYEPNDLRWDIRQTAVSVGDNCECFDQIEQIIEAVVSSVRSEDRVVIMSNGGFENFHQRLAAALKQQSS
ncbi:MAG: UDP-N-acetylmuramate:L-alanyl-gamma-D-glutamyl-meso-diaminopimelate ligase [Pseudomonadota bacterium]